MFSLLENFYQYYYVVLILQGICVIHSMRRGNQQKWIWIIVFLPLIGSIAYIFTEIVKKQDVDMVQSGVSKIINPSGRVKDLEKKYKFSNTFTNGVALADAYLQNGSYDSAVELYEYFSTGTFSDNEHVLKQMIDAYYHLGRYEDVIKIAPKLSKDIYFSKSKSNLFYALALEQINRFDLAEREFKAMNHRYSNYEARYNYGIFLARQGRKADASQIFQDIDNEAQNMNRQEKGASKAWIDKANDAWRKLG